MRESSCFPALSLSTSADSRSRLHGLEVPRDGGGTLFADMRAAFDALPASERDRLRRMTGLHKFTAGPDDARSAYATQLTPEKLAALKDWEHPAVVRHPGNGREILFVNPSHTHGFVGLARDEGTALIVALAEHAAQPAFVYHHRWRVGDLVIWDEVSTMHKGAGDSPPDQRRRRRGDGQGCRRHHHARLGAAHARNHFATEAHQSRRPRSQAGRRPARVWSAGHTRRP